MEPRILRTDEMLPLRLAASLATRRVEWIVDGRVIGATGRGADDLLVAVVPAAATVRGCWWRAARTRY